MTGDLINNADRERVADAIRAAETRTAGEIVCVLARNSSDYSYAPALWAAFIALIVPWPLIALTNYSVQIIYFAQIVVFLVAGIVLLWPPLRAHLVPRRIKRTRAHRAAMEQFFTRGLTRTPERTGVMIFVSLAERYARIVADEGIAAKVDKAEWKAAIDLLTAHMRSGDIANGFIDAIGACADILAKHVPPDGSGNDLPDKIYIM